jgi:WD40 repeat protein
VITVRTGLERTAAAGALRPDDTGIPALERDATTGQQLRQLTAHSALIRAVAFSDDGQLLASVADDDTVCVWWLADLAKSPSAWRAPRSGCSAIARAWLFAMAAAMALATAT